MTHTPESAGFGQARPGVATIRSGRWVLHAGNDAPIFTDAMNALTRLIIAIYILALAPAFVLTGGVNGTFSAIVSVGFVLGSLVAVPILLIAWIAAGLRRY